MMLIIGSNLFGGKFLQHISPLTRLAWISMCDGRLWTPPQADRH